MCPRQSSATCGATPMRESIVRMCVVGCAVAASSALVFVVRRCERENADRPSSPSAQSFLVFCIGARKDVWAGPAEYPLAWSMTASAWFDRCTRCSWPDLKRSWMIQMPAGIDLAPGQEPYFAWTGARQELKLARQFRLLPQFPMEERGDELLSDCSGYHPDRLVLKVVRSIRTAGTRFGGHQEHCVDPGRWPWSASGGRSRHLFR